MLECLMNLRHGIDSRNLVNDTMSRSFFSAPLKAFNVRVSLKEI